MTITIEQLRDYCEDKIANNEGDKKILISSDDEGNEFHDLIYAFTPMTEGLWNAYCRKDETNKKYDYIILG